MRVEITVRLDPTSKREQWVATIRVGTAAFRSLWWREVDEWRVIQAWAMEHWRFHQVRA